MPKNPQVSNQIPVACFAPPLTDELLARYADLLIQGQMPPRVRDAMQMCLRCVERWWNLPESTERATRWETQTLGRKRHYDEVPLSDELVQQLDEHTPWMEECLLYETLFDQLPDGRLNRDGTGPVIDQAAFDLKTAAKHLLWHAKEITLDREPLTADKLS